MYKRQRLTFSSYDLLTQNSYFPSNERNNQQNWLLDLLPRVDNFFRHEIRTEINVPDKIRSLEKVIGSSVLEQSYFFNTIPDFKKYIETTLKIGETVIDSIKSMKDGGGEIDLCQIDFDQSTVILEKNYRLLSQISRNFQNLQNSFNGEFIDFTSHKTPESDELFRYCSFLSYLNELQNLMILDIDTLTTSIDTNSNKAIQYIRQNASNEINEGRMTLLSKCDKIEYKNLEIVRRLYGIF